MKTFSSNEAIQFGWDIMKKNINFFVPILLIVAILYVLPSGFSEVTKNTAPFISVIVSIGGWIIQMIIGIGLIKIALKFCDNEKPTISDLFSYSSLFGKYLLGSILYSLIVLGGIILLIIPGIVWAIKYQFYSYFIVDKGFIVSEAIKKSGEITKGVKWDLFVFGILIFLINIVGVLCLFVGLFATVPTTMVAIAYVYRKLSKPLEIIPTQTQTIVTPVMIR